MIDEMGNDKLKKYQKEWRECNRKRKLKGKPVIEFEEYVNKREHPKSEEDRAEARREYRRIYMRKYMKTHYQKNKKALDEQHRQYRKKLTPEMKKELYRRNYLRLKEKFNNMSEEEKKIERAKRKVRRVRYQNNNLEKMYDNYLKKCAKEERAPKYSKEEFINGYFDRKANTNWDDSFLNDPFPFVNISEEEYKRRQKVLYRLRAKLRKEGKDTSHLINLSRIKIPPFPFEDVQFLNSDSVFPTSLTNEEYKKRRKIYDYFKKRLRKTNPKATVKDCYQLALTLYAPVLKNER